MGARIRVNLDGSIDYAGNHYEHRRRALAEPEDGRDEQPQARWWHCYGCDERFPSERGVKPKYCSRCGAEVMDA